MWRIECERRKTTTKPFIFKLYCMSLFYIQFLCRCGWRLCPCEPYSHTDNRLNWWFSMLITFTVHTHTETQFIGEAKRFICFHFIKKKSKTIIQWHNCYQNHLSFSCHTCLSLRNHEIKVKRYTDFSNRHVQHHILIKHSSYFI